MVRFVAVAYATAGLVAVQGKGRKEDAQPRGRSGSSSAYTATLRRAAVSASNSVKTSSTGSWWRSLLGGVISPSSMTGSKASSSSTRRRLDMPTNTYWGTTSCKHWPQFHLQDYQPESGSDYLESYGLGDMLPLADVTIVGLYFSDSDECRVQAQRQNDLTADLARENSDIVVHNVMLNYYMPMSCVTKECVPSWYSYPFYMPWYTDQCYGYVGGCSSTDTALTLEKWQLPLSNVTSIPLFQDTEWDNIWDDFGGGRGDLFIYDGVGRLYSYISETPGSSGFPAVSGQLTNDSVYSFVKSEALAAAKSNGTERCKTYKDDDNPTPINYDDVWYYYYYGDDDSSKKKKGDDDDSKKKGDDDDSSKKKKGDDDDKDDDKSADTATGDAASETATAEEDDGWRPGMHGTGDDDDYDDDDAFWNNKKTKKTYKGYGTKKGGIPSYIVASLIAVLAFAVSAGIFWLRRNYLQASGGGMSYYSPAGTGGSSGVGGITHGFMKLPTSDAGSSSLPDNQLEVEMRAPGVTSPARVKDEGSYGSL